MFEDYLKGGVSAKMDYLSIVVDFIFISFCLIGFKNCDILTVMIVIIMI